MENCQVSNSFFTQICLTSYLIPIRFKHSPWHLVPTLLQSTQFTECQTEFNTLLNMVTFADLGSRQKKETLWTERKLELPEFPLPINFLISNVIIWQCLSQRFSFCHIFIGSVNFISAVILPYILVTRCQHIRSSLYVYSLTSLLGSGDWTVYVSSN